MKIGILGGSFNPPHLGHIHITNLAIKKLGLNQVWWIPTAHNPLKDISIYEDYSARYKKCQIITKDCKKIRLKKFDEIQTINLIKKLQRKYKNHQFFWIMGADSLNRFHEWNDFKKLMKLLPIAIFNRDKFLPKISQAKSFKIYQKLRQFDQKLPKLSRFRTKNLDISSTYIRNNQNA